MAAHHTTFLRPMIYPIVVSSAPPEGFAAIGNNSDVYRKVTRFVRTLSSRPIALLLGFSDFSQLLPVPRMRSIPLLNLARIPFRDSDGRSNGRHGNVREQGLNFLLVELWSEPCWLV